VKKRTLTILAIALLALGAASAAGAKQKLTFVLTLEAKSLDPTISAETGAAPIMENCFEGLIHIDKDGKFQPASAESWAVSKDGLTYTFKLRKDAKWSDGKPVTARDFVYSFTRLMDPASGAEYAALATTYIKNGAAFAAGKAKAGELGLRASGDSTFIMTLERPTPYMLSLLSFSAFLPVRQDVVEKDPLTWFKSPATYISNGPFVMKENKFGESVLLVKNKAYWDAKSVRLEEIHFDYIFDGNTALNAMEGKKVDGLMGVASTEIPRLKAQSDSLVILPRVGTTFIDFNVKAKPFDDPRVRRAFALAIDRKSIVASVTQAGEKPASGLVPDSMVYNGYSIRKLAGDYGIGASANVAEAKKLLAAAGYPDGKGFPSVALQYYSNDTIKKVSEAIQQMWKKNLGIEVELRNKEWKVHYQDMLDGNFQMAFTGWGADYMHPMTYMELFESKSPNNQTGWASPAYDKFVADSITAGDESSSMKLLVAAEKELMAAMPIIPIYYQTNPAMMAPYVKGWYKLPIGTFVFKNAYIDK
jgi:oligopeptide transport system substrate-binding protein